MQVGEVALERRHAGRRQDDPPTADRQDREREAEQAQDAAREQVLEAVQVRPVATGSGSSDGPVGSESCRLMSKTWPVSPDPINRSVAAATSSVESMPGARLLGKGAPAHGRVGPLGADGVDANAVIAPLLGEALRQVDHGGLARRVRHVVGAAAGERARGEDGQRAGARPQVRMRRPGDVEGAGQVDVDDLGQIRRLGLHDGPDAQDAGGHDDVVEPAHLRRGGLDVGRDIRVVADVQAQRAPIDLDQRALAARLVRDAKPDPVRPADDVDARPGHRLRRSRIVRRGDGAHLEHAIGEHEVDPRRDLEVDLVAGDGHDPGARHVAQDEAAVVRGREVAGRRGRRVRLGEDALAEHLRRLAAAVSGAIGDLDDAVAIDDHERVRARDDGVRRIRDAARDRLDRPHDDLDRHQRPDRVVDDHDVVIGRVEAQQSVQGALVACPATRDDRGREGQPRCGDDRLRLGRPSPGARR